MENVKTITLVDENKKVVGSIDSVQVVGASSVTYGKDNINLTIMVKTSKNNIKNITGDNIMEISTKK